MAENTDVGKGRGRDGEMNFHCPDFDKCKVKMLGVQINCTSAHLSSLLLPGISDM